MSGEMSLRPRPGESPQDVIERVTAAAKGRSLDRALDRFVESLDHSNYEVKAEGTDHLEVDVWVGPEDEYAGRWSVPREGEPSRLDLL